METVFIKESKENWVWGKMKVKVDDEGNKIEPYYKYDLNTNHVFYCYLSENIFEEYDEYEDDYENLLPDPNETRH